MSHETQHDDLRATFANPWVWLITHSLFPLLVVASTAFCAWLLWSDLEPGARQLSITAIAVPAVMATLSLLATFIYCRRQIPLWASIAGAVFGIAYLIGYFTLIETLIPPSTPSWMVSASYPLLVLAGMMPLVLSDIWRIASMPLPLSNMKDKIFTIAAVPCIPILSFILIQTIIVTSALSHRGGSSSIFVYSIIITLCAAAPILFFLALFRALMWVRLWVKTRKVKHPARSEIYMTLLVAIVLPIFGLGLNYYIPFPANFQNPWVYALTLLNGTILALPHRSNLIFALRWFTFPFTFYFFLIFLPFLPLSIPAMIAVGMGFLILAPILLFWRHVSMLGQDWRASTLPLIQKLAIAILAIALIPGTLLTNAFLDRAAFRNILDYAFTPDVTHDATLPTSPARIRRVLERADAFKNQDETPILSAIYTQIVFDGLVLPDHRFDFMWDCYVGEKLDEKENTLWRGGNMFGQLFARNNARVQRWDRRVSPPRSAILDSSELTIDVSTNTLEQTVTLRLRITSPDHNQQEFRAPITLPSATWVTGMKLKIDGEWKDASIIERRAAEWVYKQITSQRRDPALLTLDTPEEGLLRVYPVTSALPRDLEITFLQPAGLHGEIKIGDKKIEIPFNPDTANKLQNPICAGGTLFIPTATSTSEPHAIWAVIDSSREGLTREQTKKLLAEQNRPFTHILSVNAETKLTTLTGDFNETMLLPNRFGLDAIRAVRQIEHQIRNTLSSTQTAEAVFFGDKWEKHLPKTIDALQRSEIVTTSGTLITREEPRRTHTRLYPNTYTPTHPDTLHFSQGAQLWRLQQDCADRGTLNQNFRKLLTESSRTGILLPQTSYIVVETDAQRKMLAVKQAEAANAHQALDFDYVKTDAPSLLLLVLAFVLIKFLPRFLRRLKAGC